MDKMPDWLRWALALPSAIISYFVVQLIVSVLHGLAEYFNGLDPQLFPTITILGNFLPQFVNSIASPYLFVKVGAHFAPNHKYETSVVFAVFISVATVVLTVVWIKYFPKMSFEGLVGMPWLIITSVAGVFAAIKACLELHPRNV